MSYRREIEWDSTCAAGTIQDLADHVKPLKHVVDYQWDLIVVNGIFGLGILGIVIPLTMFMHACDKDNDLPCIPGSGQQERDNLGRFQKVLSFASKVAKMIPLIYCLNATDSIHTFFKLAGSSNCSDEVTNKSMSELGREIDRVKESNYRTLYLDIAMICYYVLYLIYSMYKHFKNKKNADTGEQNGGAVEQPIMIQPAPQQNMVPMQQMPVQQVNVMHPGQQMVNPAPAYPQSPIQAQVQHPQYPQYGAPQIQHQQPAPSASPQIQYQQPAPSAPPQFPQQPMQPAYQQPGAYQQAPVAYQQPPVVYQQVPVGYAQQQQQQQQQPVVYVQQQLSQAATKIQSVWRGNQVRRQVQEEKRQNPNIYQAAQQPLKQGAQQPGQDAMAQYQYRM